MPTSVPYWSPEVAHSFLLPLASITVLWPPLANIFLIKKKNSPVASFSLRPVSFRHPIALWGQSVHLDRVDVAKVPPHAIMNPSKVSRKSPSADVLLASHADLSRGCAFGSRTLCPLSRSEVLVWVTSAPPNKTMFKKKKKSSAAKSNQMARHPPSSHCYI